MPTFHYTHHIHHIVLFLYTPGGRFIACFPRFVVSNHHCRASRSTVILCRYINHSQSTSEERTSGIAHAISLSSDRHAGRPYRRTANGLLFRRGEAHGEMGGARILILISGCARILPCSPSWWKAHSHLASSALGRNFRFIFTSGHC